MLYFSIYFQRDPLAGSSTAQPRHLKTSLGEQSLITLNSFNDTRRYVVVLRRDSIHFYIVSCEAFPVELISGNLVDLCTYCLILDVLNYCLLHSKSLLEKAMQENRP